MRGLVLAALVASSAGAEPLLARETAHVGGKWDYSVGLLAPLTLGVADGLELRAHPVLFFVAPNLDVRVSHWRSSDWRLTGEYGLSVPTPLMRLTQGYLFPTSGRTIGWWVVPHAGAALSHGAAEGAVLTLSADLAVGLPLSKSEVTPLGAWPFLDVLFAPTLSRYRARLGAAYDYPLSDRWRVRAYGDLFLHGANPSPFTLRAGAGVDLRIGRMSRLAVGGVWWSSDQHAIDPTTLQRVRSNDFLPTLDFIWAG